MYKKQTRAFYLIQSTKSAAPNCQKQILDNLWKLEEMKNSMQTQAPYFQHGQTAEQ